MLSLFCMGNYPFIQFRVDFLSRFGVLIVVNSALYA